MEQDFDFVGLKVEMNAQRQDRPEIDTSIKLFIKELDI